MQTEAKSAISSSERLVQGYAGNVGHFSTCGMKMLLHDGKVLCDGVLHGKVDPSMALPEILALCTVMNHHLSTLQQMFNPEAEFLSSKQDLSDEMLHEIIELEYQRVIDYIDKRNNPHKVKQKEG